MNNVSVPSRGVRCLNEHISDHWDEYVDVFVPSRGVRYLNAWGGHLAEGYLMFSSPLGD